MYKLINILYKNTTFKRYDIHTNINATLSVIIIIYISQYTFSFLVHKKNNMLVYLLSFIFFLCFSISVLSVPQQTPYSSIYPKKVPIAVIQKFDIKISIPPASRGTNSTESILHLNSVI